MDFLTGCAWCAFFLLVFVSVVLMRGDVTEGK